MSSKLLSLVLPVWRSSINPFWEPTASKFNESNHGYRPHKVQGLEFVPRHAAPAMEWLRGAATPGPRSHPPLPKLPPFMGLGSSTSRWLCSKTGQRATFWLEPVFLQIIQVDVLVFHGHPPSRFAQGQSGPLRRLSMRPPFGRWLMDFNGCQDSFANVFYYVSFRSHWFARAGALPFFTRDTFDIILTSFIF